MAKNQRRQRRTSNTASQSSRRSRTANVPATQASTGTASSSGAVDWDNEYGYVIRDLRQLSIISVVLFVVMIIIGFFL